MRFAVPSVPGARVALASLALLLAAGCVRPESAADRHFTEMRDSVGKLQAEQDRQTRRMLEGDDKIVDPPPPRPLPAPSVTAPFATRAVQIGVDREAASVSDDPNAPGVRPEIRVYGPGGAAHAARSKARRGEVRIEPASPEDADQKSPPPRDESRGRGSKESR